VCVCTHVRAYVACAYMCMYACMCGVMYEYVYALYIAVIMVLFSAVNRAVPSISASNCELYYCIRTRLRIVFANIASCEHV